MPSRLFSHLHLLVAAQAGLEFVCVCGHDGVVPPAAIHGDFGDFGDEALERFPHRDATRPAFRKRRPPASFLRGELEHVPVTRLVFEKLTPQRRCCTARSKSLTSLCRLQSHPAQYVSGIPSAAILLSISHPIRCSTRCLANVRARISGPMIALPDHAPNRLAVPSIYSSASPWVGSQPCGAKYPGFPSARIPRASKLLICGLFQKGRVLAQDGVMCFEPRPIVCTSWAAERVNDFETPAGCI